MEITREQQGGKLKYLYHILESLHHPGLETFVTTDQRGI